MDLGIGIPRLYDDAIASPESLDMNANDFRRIALSLPGAEESSHMGQGGRPGKIAGIAVIARDRRDRTWIRSPKSPLCTSLVRTLVLRRSSRSDSARFRRFRRSRRSLVLALAAIRRPRER